jgi:hypothetical protein
MGQFSKAGPYSVTAFRPAGAALIAIRPPPTDQRKGTSASRKHGSDVGPMATPSCSQS